MLPVAISVCVCAHAYVYGYICLSVSMHVCLCIYLSFVHAYVSFCLYVCVYLPGGVYIAVWVCMHESCV